MSCAHRYTRKFKVTGDPLGDPRVIERCVDCGLNVRGAGAWVSLDELRGPVSDLAEDPFENKADPRQIKLPW